MPEYSIYLYNKINLKFDIPLKMSWLRIAVFFLCSYQADAKGQKIGVMADAGQQ